MAKAKTTKTAKAKNGKDVKKVVPTFKFMGTYIKHQIANDGFKDMDLDAIAKDVKSMFPKLDKDPVSCYKWYLSQARSQKKQEAKGGV